MEDSQLTVSSMDSSQNTDAVMDMMSCIVLWVHTHSVWQEELLQRHWALTESLIHCVLSRYFVAFGPVSPLHGEWLIVVAYWQLCR